MLKSFLDVAKDIRSGKIGVIESIRIGDVVISALTGLRASDSVTVTDRPVQAGFLVTEGVVRNPRERSFDIVLADPQMSLEAGLDAALTGSWSGFTESWRDKRDTLYKHLRNFDIVPAVSHFESIDRMIVTEINPMFDSEENWDCFMATVELREWDERGVTSAADVDNALAAAEVNVGAL